MKKKVLFLCPGNSCHSQMAEGLLKHFRGNDFEVFSAGLKPMEMSKNAVAVMKEIGIDISKQKPKTLNDFLNEEFDIVITFRGDETKKESEIVNAIKKYNWELFDPSEKISTQGDLPKAFRELRDEIKLKIEEYL